MRKASCSFCSIVVGDAPAEVVTRTDSWVAFFPPEPATLGHTLVVPTRHVADIWGLNSAEAGQLADGVLRLAHAIRAALAPEGLNVLQSNGTVATQTVAHLHVHLVPRTTGDAMGDLWPSASPVLSIDDKMRALNSMRSAVEAVER